MAVARLFADIGGTNVRFAVQRGAEPATEIMVLATEDYAGLHQAALSYLGRKTIAMVRIGVFHLATLSIPSRSPATVRVTTAARMPLK